MGARLEANERWAKSSKTYRSSVAAEVFLAKMKDICGPNGSDGPHPFVVKKRPPRDGGDWDMNACIEGRSKSGDAVYKQAEKAFTTIHNKIVPLFYRLFPDAVLPSGWQKEDALALVEFNLAKMEEFKKDKKRAAARGTAEDPVDTEDLQAGEQAESPTPAGEDEANGDVEINGDTFGTQQAAFVELDEQGDDDADVDADADDLEGRDCFEPYTKKNDFEKVDPSTYQRKEISTLAWYIYGQLGANDPNFAKSPDRTSSSSRSEQRAKGEQRAKKQDIRRDRGFESPHMPSEPHVDANYDTAASAQTDRETLDVAAKIHHNALRAYYNDANALKVMCKLAPDEEAKKAAYTNYTMYFDNRPAPTLEDAIATVKNASKKQNAGSSSAPSSAALDSSSDPEDDPL